MPRSTVPYAERFWSRVDRSGGPDSCWIWTKTRDKDGYGVWRYGQRSGCRVPRIAWALSHNDEWPDGLWVLHTCDNPPCCNPAHLFLGTPLDNQLDMIRKGRQRSATGAARARISASVPRGDRHYLRQHPEKRRFGADHWHTIVSDDDVRAIRARWAAGNVLQKDLATEYGVSKQHVSAIILGKFRTHVK